MDQRFSEEQAKVILGRAIEIDSLAPTSTVSDLRAIATDLGVSQAALDAALAEQTHVPAPRRSVGATRATVAIAAMGLPLGIVSGALAATGSPYQMLAATALMGVGLAASGGLVVLQGRSATLRSFHLANLTLWAGVAAGGLAAAAFVTDGPTMGVMLTLGWSQKNWLASSILGSTAVFAARRAGRSGSESDGTAAPPRGTRRLRRIVNRWIAAVRNVFSWNAAERVRDAVDALPRRHSYTFGAHS